MRENRILKLYFQIAALIFYCFSHVYLSDLKRWALKNKDRFHEKQICAEST